MKWRFLLWGLKPAKHQLNHSASAALLDVNLAGEKAFFVADQLRRLGMPFALASGRPGRIATGSEGRSDDPEAV